MDCHLVPRRRVRIFSEERDGKHSSSSVRDFLNKLMAGNNDECLDTNKKMVIESQYVSAPALKLAGQGTNRKGGPPAQTMTRPANELKSKKTALTVAVTDANHPERSVSVELPILSVYPKDLLKLFNSVNSLIIKPNAKTKLKCPKINKLFVKRTFIVSTQLIKILIFRFLIKRHTIIQVL